MANMTQRSLFEQQLCLQLLSFSEVTEALAERVLHLEQRLAGVQQQLDDPAEETSVDDGLTELLSESESRVRKLKDLLEGGKVIALDAGGEAPMDASEAQDAVNDGEESDAETEYVDDPQIDLLSA